MSQHEHFSGMTPEQVNEWRTSLYAAAREFAGAAAIAQERQKPTDDKLREAFHQLVDIRGKSGGTIYLEEIRLGLNQTQEWQDPDLDPYSQDTYSIDNFDIKLSGFDVDPPAGDSGGHLQEGDLSGYTEFLPRLGPYQAN